MSFEKEVSSATGIWAWRSLTILANENTSSSPTLYIVRMKSNESSRPSSSNASRVELTRVNDGGVRHVQGEVFLVDLRFDVSVLLEDIPVVAAADQQDLMDSVFHEPVLGLVPVRQVFFEILVHRDFVYFNKNRKKSPTGKKKFPDGR